MPLVVLLSRANSRRRAADAELPFFLMTLSVFVHEANPTLQEGFKRVTAIGARVFPAFTKEGEILARDDAFVPGSPMGVAEKAFAGHPSARVRAFVQGFLKTLATGKDISEFVRQETSFQIQKLEQAWSSFSVSVGSLAEVDVHPPRALPRGPRDGRRHHLGVHVIVPLPRVLRPPGRGRGGLPRPDGLDTTHRLRPAALGRLAGGLPRWLVGLDGRVPGRAARRARIHPSSPLRLRRRVLRDEAALLEDQEGRGGGERDAPRPRRGEQGGGEPP